MKDGFIKVAAASPVIRVADTDYNAEKVIETMHLADKKGVKLLVFPELTLTGCSCYDMIAHQVVIDGAREALLKVTDASVGMDMLVFVGLPVAVGSRLYSCAAAISSGELLGLVPRENVSGTHFSRCRQPMELSIGGYAVPLSADTLFVSSAIPGLSVAVESGTDLDSPIPPSTRHAVAGASLIVRMASFPETVSSTDKALLELLSLSGRLSAGMVLAAPGKGESTTDNVYSGLCAVAENGVVLASDEGENSMALSELDISHMMNLRRARGGFDCGESRYTTVMWNTASVVTELTRKYSKLPHLPDRAEDVPAFCRRMLDIQVSGLVKRMEYAHLDHFVVGISGGVDSTLAVMICTMAAKKMGLPPENVVACTMPCFGTSSRTRSNAITVAEQCRAQVRVIDISKSVNQHFDDIGHAHDDYSVAFENAQARERTQILMDIANKVNGLAVGTEDQSEFIDGWCTFNGDHISNYDVNLGLTKTQVRANVRFIAQTTQDQTLAASLWDVLDCPVTPELLPIHDDQIVQKSEDSVGSYSLQDFFTHKILVCGFSPAKTLRLAKYVYGDEFSDAELRRWLTSYSKRLFSQQFKRSCLMDGPAVDNFTVSPRTGFLMPSDGENSMFLKNLEKGN